MKKIWPWLVGLGVIVIIGLVVLFGAGLLWTQRMPVSRYQIEEGERIFRDGIWNHPRMGMRTDLPVIGLSILNWLLLLMIPLVLLGLFVLGIFTMVRYLNRSSRDQIDHPVYRCQHCGRGVEPDWKVCPYCGENLGGD